MSADIDTIETIRGPLYVTAFYAGKEHGGVALQLGQSYGSGADATGFIQIGQDDIPRLLPVLENWLEACRRVAKEKEATK